MEECYSLQGFNATSHDVVALITVTLQTFAGMWINAFIIYVLCTAWLKEKSFNSNEKIMLFLGCTRFWYLGITWVYCIFSIVYPWSFYVHPIPQLFAAIQTFLNSSNLWVSACLCGFYCVKIANFRHNFFTYLKFKIDTMVPWLLLCSLLLSLVICILVYDITNKVPCNNFNATTLGNFWKLTARLDEHFFPIFFISGFGFAISFLAVMSSTLLLLFSLWKHKCKMQTNSVKDLSMDAHVKAMKSILSFFLIYSVNFVCLILTLVYATKKENPVTFFVLVFQYVFPAVHSLALIFSNPKLEKSLLRTLSCAKCKVCRR